MKFGRLFSILFVVFAAMFISGCQSMGATNTRVEAAPSPSPQIVMTQEQAILACYADSQWTGKRPIMSIPNFADVSGKGTYGDTGQGAMFPSNSILVARNGLLAAGMTHAPRDKETLTTMTNEASLGLRSPADQKAAIRPDIYLNGTISGADALSAAVHELIVYGGGGGPATQRYEIYVDLIATSAHGNADIAGTALSGQYVQNELKLLFADFIGKGSGKTLLTAQSETIVRTRLQGLIRNIVYAAEADILRKLPGSPANCNQKTLKHITPRFVQRTV